MHYIMVAEPVEAIAERGVAELLKVIAEFAAAIPIKLVASTGSATAMLPPLCFTNFNVAEMGAVFPRWLSLPKP